MYIRSQVLWLQKKTWLCGAQVIRPICYFHCVFLSFSSFLDLDSSIHLHCVWKITYCVPQKNYSYRFLNDMRVRKWFHGELFWTFASCEYFECEKQSVCDWTEWGLVWSSHNLYPSAFLKRVISRCPWGVEIHSQLIKHNTKLLKWQSCPLCN